MLLLNKPQDNTMRRLITRVSLSCALLACSEKESDTSIEEMDTSQEDTAIAEDDLVDDDDTQTEDEPVEESLIDECDLIDVDATSVVLPSSAEEAAQLILIPDTGETYHLTKEAAVDGWFVLEVPSWMCEVELYTTDAVSIELETSPDWDLGDVAAPVSECEDIGLIRHSWTFHAWGSYVVHIEATDSTELWLGTRMVSPTAG